MSVLERCPSYKESNKGIGKGRNQLYRCPFYRGVRLIEVSVKRESTVSAQSVNLKKAGMASQNIVTKNNTRCRKRNYFW